MTAAAASPPTRALILEPLQYAFCRSIQIGAIDAARRRGWEAIAIDPWPVSPDLLVQLRPDVIIAHNEDQAQVRALASLARAVVVTTLGDDGTPRVNPDDRRIARMAVEHLQQRHLRHLAFLGHEDRWGVSRRDAFIDAVAAAGLPPPQVRMAGWLEPLAGLRTWLQQLPAPCGLFVFADHLATLALVTAQEAGRRIPEDLAIIGCDNDAAMCENVRPSLTSIDSDGQAVGRTAIELAERILAGEALPPMPILVTPSSLIARGSTDWVACDDALVASALRLLRSGAMLAPSVDQLAAAVGASRSTLEERFRRELGSTPAQEIASVRMAMVAEVLRTTDLGLAAVAERTGFSSKTALIHAVRRSLGFTPAVWRAKLRGQDPASAGGEDEAGPEA